METNLLSLLAILGMALITYLTRAGGLLLMSRIQFSPRLKAWLSALPGTILVAIVAPTVLSTSFAEAGAALATLLVAARTRNVLLAMLTGVVVVFCLRLLQTHLR